MVNEAPSLQARLTQSPSWSSGQMAEAAITQPMEMENKSLSRVCANKLADVCSQALAFLAGTQGSQEPL